MQSTKNLFLLRRSASQQVYKRAAIKFFCEDQKVMILLNQMSSIQFLLDEMGDDDDYETSMENYKELVDVEEIRS
jgi:hypothetical protein